MIYGNIEIKDLKTGKINSFPIHSFTYNFLGVLFYDLFKIWNPLRPKRVNGEEYIHQHGQVVAAADINDYGVLIGDGVVAESCDQYNLGNKLDLTEGESVVSEVGLDGQVAKLEVYRTFSNNSGSDETINEIALVTDAWVSAQYQRVMTIRDKLDEGVVFSDGASHSVMFTFSLTNGLTKNFLIALKSIFNMLDEIYRDTDGNYITGFFSHTQQGCYPISIVAPEDTKTYGIQIGTNNTAIDIEDYKLGTQLISDWKHYITEKFLSELDVVTGICRIGVLRLFKNETGASVDVNEMALVVRGTGISDAKPCLIGRYLTGGITVQDGQTLLLRVRLKTTM